MESCYMQTNRPATWGLSDMSCITRIRFRKTIKTEVFLKRLNTAIHNVSH